MERTETVRTSDGESATDDVVEQILSDHRAMEEPFREMRSVEADRTGALRRFADPLIARSAAAELESPVEAVAHHLVEEERSLVNDTGENVAPARRRALGRAFARARRDQLASAQGRVENVRRVVAAGTA